MRDGYKTSLSERDVEILKAVYQLQAIRTKDITDVYFQGRPYGYDRLRVLCDKGYLKRSFTVTNKGRQHNSVYSIGERAIDVLFNLGKIEQKRRARDLKLPTMEMISRIEVSKIAINLAKEGWEILGSIEGKIKRELPTRSLMQCLLTSPDKRQYQVYQLQNTIHEGTLAKLMTELTTNKQGNIVLYKYSSDKLLDEPPSYQDLVNEITEQRTAIQELCLIPMVEWEDNEKVRNLAIEMITYGSDKQAEQYLRKRYGKVKYSDNRYGFGEMVVEQAGMDYMVCNYLRRDRSALRLLAEYFTERDHKNTGKGAIVLTWIGFAKEVQQVIDRYQKRDFIQVKGVTTQEIIESHGEDG